MEQLKRVDQALCVHSMSMCTGSSLDCYYDA
jgi:hypothetical protein